jgi:hypothetical protein
VAFQERESKKRAINIRNNTREWPSERHLNLLSSFSQPETAVNCAGQAIDTKTKQTSEM